MSETHILICDRDSAYVGALVKFLLGTSHNYIVSTYTDPEAYKLDRGRYKIALMTKDFIRISEEYKVKNEIGKLIQLTNDHDEQDAGVEQLYKFQAMDEFIERIYKADTVNHGNGGSDTRFIGVYSPIHHELSLPFTLMMSQILLEEGKVLLVSLEQNSILGDLMGKSFPKTITDYLYQLENNESDIFNCLEYYEGIAYLPPARIPGELSTIRANQWQKLLDNIESQGFSIVVILFDELQEGILNLMNRCDELVVLGRPGDYYRKFQRRFLNFLKLNGINAPIRDVNLPMSANNLNDGQYQLEELYQGNLGNFIRANFEVGLAYGVG